MENFEIKIAATEKITKKNGGIFDDNDISNRIIDLNNTLSKENFWKDKDLVKKTVKQKIFLKIFKSHIKILLMRLET